MNSFQQAVRDGFLRCRNECRRSLQLQTEWRWYCLENNLPCLFAWPVGYLELELGGHWWLSAELAADIHATLGHAYRRGSCLRFDSIPPRKLIAQARLLLEVLRSNRPNRSHHWASELQQGMAVCTFNKAFEEYLEEGASYYVREIPNMTGHVVVFLPGREPLVGIHLDRFEFASSYAGA